MRRRIIVGISGASGPIYGIRLLEALSRIKEIETHLVMTESTEETIRYELPGWTAAKVRKLANVVHDPKDLAAPISSGSFKTDGMIVAPCSMKTLANIAHSTGGDLLSRAADVVLKERRKLVIVPRETPLHLGHLRNLVSVAEIGAIVVPPIPAFYHGPKTIDDIIHHTIGKILDVFEIKHQLFKRWKS